MVTAAARWLPSDRGRHVRLALTGRGGPSARGRLPGDGRGLPAIVASGFAPLFGDVFVRYRDGNSARAEIKGSVAGGKAGEIVRLYDQRFPFTSAPALADWVTLNPAANGTGYAFTVTPTIATRYQVKLFANASASVPLASSVISTIYVLGYSRIVRNTGCVGVPVCHATVVSAVEDPPAGIQASLNDPWYAYLGTTVGPAGSSVADPTSMQLGLENAAISVHRTGDDSLSLTLTFSYNVGNDAYSLQYADCVRASRRRTGSGFRAATAAGMNCRPGPRPHSSGISASLSNSETGQGRYHGPFPMSLMLNSLGFSNHAR